MFSFHLAPLSPVRSALALARPRPAAVVPGLRHAEYLAQMELGAPVISPARMQLRSIAVFAAWEGESALEEFLEQDRFGQVLARGWHVRLQFLRRWGQVRAIGNLPEIGERSAPSEPVVAVTLARMRFLQIPRFVHWGRPVERLVRDHPGTTLALAERERRDFHHEFTTLRFRPLSEHGTWQGRTGIVPGL